MRMRMYFIIIIVLCLVITILYLHVTRYHVYLTTKSPNGRYVAQIMWKRAFPYIQGVDAILVVRDLENNETKLKKVLIQNRDAFADIEFEFQNISWDVNKLILELNRRHYMGPIVFEIDKE